MTDQMETAPTPTLTVTVDVSNLSLDMVAGVHRTWEEGSYEDGVPGGWREEPATLRDLVVDQLVHRLITKDLQQAVREIRNEVIRELVQDAVRKALDEPFTLTNNWGERQGEPTTLRGVIVAAAEKALTVKVNRDGFSNSRQETITEQFIRQHTDAALKKELQGVMDAEKAKVIKAMQEKGAKVVAEMLAAGLPGRH